MTALWHNDGDDDEPDYDDADYCVDDGHCVPRPYRTEFVPEGEGVYVDGGGGDTGTDDRIRCRWPLEAPR